MVAFGIDAGRRRGRAGCARRLVGLALLVCSGQQLWGCGGNDGCSDELEVVQSFLEEPAHLTCATNEDCIVVSTGCHTFPTGSCSQAQLNRQAASSRAWRDRQALLQNCELFDCGFCGAALIPSCVEGRCGGALQ